MTSTNDGKEVKSHLSSGPKGKTYFIELYKTLEAKLNEASSVKQRIHHLCEAWLRIHNLCLHSAPSTHPHLLSWLQKHTSRAVLQTGWQSPDRKDERSRLTEAINVLIVECRSAAANRDGASPPWEQQLVARGEWFKRVLDRPWEHPVLNCLLNPDGTPPTDDEVLEWLTEERGVTFVMRLQTLVAEKQCDDIAVALATAVMDRVRNDTELNPEADQPVEPKDKPEKTSSSFGDRLKEEAGFTQDVWELLTDIEFVLLHKRDSSRCIALAKQTPLRSAYQLIERLQCRLDTSPREKRLWKNSKEVAVLIAQVVIARCMVIPQCTGGARSALYCCSRSLARLMPSSRLPSAAAALAAPAPTAAHLHTLAAAVDAQLALKTDSSMKPFVCELYVRAITAGMNELERLKLKTEKDTEARSMEQTLATWFVQLGAVLACSDRFKCECALTAFSVHPSPQMYEKIKAAPALPPIHLDSVETTSTEVTNPEFGSWASDSRSQTNFVKTSETLNLKARQYQANVLSMAIFNEGEALGLSPELCQDITALLSGPRVKTLSWDMDRELLLENCRAYLERTHGGTKAVTTELKYLNLNPADFQYLPEEDEDENNIYYGIEKGYEHLVEPGPEDIWEDAYEHFEKADPVYSSEEYNFTPPQRKKKTKKPVSNSDEDDPLSNVAETKRKEQKERPHSKERCKEKKKVTDPLEKKVPEDKTAPGDPLEIGEGSQVKKEKPKRVRKKKEKIQKSTDGSLSSLVGLKVGKSKKKHIQNLTISDADNQGKSMIQSMNSEDNVLYDGQFSMDDMKSPRSSYSSDSLIQNNEYTMANERERITQKTHQSPFSRPYRPASISNVRMTSPTPYNPQSPSEHNIKNSPVRISEDVKSSISKLLDFRRLKANAIMREASMAIDNHISPKAVVIPEIPKSYINKQQSEKIIELKQKVDDLLKLRKQSEVAIPSPVIQYANKKYTSTGQTIQSYSSSQYNTIKKDQRTPVDRCFSTPSMGKSDRFLQSVSLVSIYDKNEAPHSLNPFAVKPSPYSNLPERRQPNIDLSQLKHQDYLHEFHRHNAYNQYAERKESTKKVIKPTSRVTPVLPNMKSDSHTPQSAKQQSQKKPDGSLNTFSRLSYYKNKQTDMRNKSQDPQLNQATVGSKLDGFIMDHLVQSQHSDKLSLSNDSQTMIKNYEKPQMNASHPLIANILQGNAQVQHRQHDTSPKTVLSENEMLLLLRKQGTFNKSQNLTNASCSKASPSMQNLPVASCSKTMISNTDAIYDSNSSIMPSNPSKSKEGNKKVNDGQMTNIMSTSFVKSAEPSKAPNLKPANTQKPTAQGKSKKTEGKSQQKSAAKSDTFVHKTPEEWENVMNAILKQKTPCRGPNALDMALNKSSFEKAFEESLRKPSVLYMSSDNSSAENLISSVEYNHEQFVKTPKSETATSSTTINMPNANKKMNSLLKTQICSPAQPKIFSNTVEKRMKQQKNYPKVLENLMQQNNIEITRTNTNNMQIEIPEKTLKQSNIIKPKDAAQRHAKLSKMHVQQIHTEIPEKDVKPIQFEIPKNNAKQIIDTSEKDTKQLEKPNKEAKHAEEFKKIHPEVQMKQFTYVRPKQEDPYVSGIPNSDYDLLDELMDDDLRKEIGELSSDEESYNASTQDFLQDNKTVKKPISVVYNPPLNQVVAKHPHDGIVIKAPGHLPICKPNEKPQSLAHKPHQRPNNKEPTEVKITPKRPNQVIPVMDGNATNIQNIVLTHGVAKPCQTRSYNNSNKLHSQITVEPKVYIAALPQPAPVQNVMIIPSNLVYEGFSSVQTPIQAVMNIAPNVYMTVNNEPSLNVYQTNQFSAPVVSPPIIASAVTVPVVHNMPCVTTVQSKPVTKVTHSQYSYSNNQLHEPTHSTTAHGNMVVDDDKLDAKVSSSVSNSVVENAMHVKPENITHANVNVNKSGERKVLKEVQEKKADENIDCKRRSQKVRDKHLKTQADQERLMKKRMAILNRKISNFCGVRTIALGYSPLQLSFPIEQKKHDVVEKETSSIQNNLQELNNEIKSPATPDSCKENKSEVLQFRRILLRSSNKLKSEISSSITSPKPSLDKKLSPVVSLATPNETSSDNVHSLLETNNKQKRASKRIRNKSITTPKDAQNKDTKVARSNLPRKKATRTPKVSKKNKTNNISSVIENPSLTQDFDTEQFFDIEAELLGSTIPNILPINLQGPDPHKVKLPVIKEKETAETLTPDMKKIEPLQSQDDPLQKGIELPVNKTKSSEQLDSVKISTEFCHITATKSNDTNQTEQTNEINNDSAQTSDLIISTEIRSAETEITKEKDDNILETVVYKRLPILKETVFESIKTNENGTHIDEGNISNEADGPYTGLVSEKLPNLQFINTPTSPQVYLDTISKSEETQTLPINLKYPAKVNSFNHKSMVDQTNIAHEILDLNKSSKTATPQVGVAIPATSTNDVDVVIIGDKPAISPPSHSTAHKLKLPHSNVSKDRFMIKNVTTSHNRDPLKKDFRIKLENGQIFRGTASGSENIETIMENPEFMSLLANQFRKPKKSYVLKINVNKNVSNGNIVLSSHIQQEIKPQAPLETVSLLSDDEEEVSPQVFETEYGKHRINSMDLDIFKKHQNKFKLKSYVLVNKLSMVEDVIKHRSESNLMDAKFNEQTQPECVILDVDSINLESSPSLDCVKKISGEEILTAIPTKYVQGVFDDIENILAPLNKDHKEESIVLIDDSSNDSDKTPEPKEKIDELKNKLLKDLGVDNILSATIESSDDVQVTWASDAIDLTDDSVMENTKCPHKEELTDDSVMKTFECSDIETLYGKLDYQKIINRHYFVKLVRCDHLVNPSSKPRPIEIQDDKSEENDVIPAPVSRSGSFSILEEFPVTNITKSEYEIHRSSPVMEAYDAIALLEGKFSVRNSNKLSVDLPKCDSEWMATKKIQHVECLNKLTVELSFKSFVVPKLASLILAFIQEGELLNKYNLLYRFHPLPISLKRKSKSTLVPITKISKLDNLPEPQPNGSTSITLDIPATDTPNVRMIDDNDIIVAFKTGAEEDLMIDDLDITPDLSDTEVTNIKASDYNNKDDVTLINKNTDYKDEQVVDHHVVNVKINKRLEESVIKKVTLCQNDYNTDAETEEETMIDVTPDLSDTEMTSVKVSDNNDKGDATLNYKENNYKDNPMVNYLKENMKIDCIIKEVEVCPNYSETVSTDVKTAVKPMLNSLDTSDSSKYNLTKITEEYQTIKISKETLIEASLAEEINDDIPIDCSNIHFCMEQTEDGPLPISIQTYTDTQSFSAHAEIEDNNKTICIAVFQSDVTESNNNNNSALPVDQAIVSEFCGMPTNKIEEPSPLKVIETGLTDEVSSTEKELDDRHYDKNDKIFNVEELGYYNVSMDVDEKKIICEFSSDAQENNITVEEIDLPNYNASVHVDIPLEIIVKSVSLENASGALRETIIDEGTIEKCIDGDYLFTDEIKVPVASKIEEASLEVTVMDIQKTDEPACTNFSDKSNCKLAPEDSSELRHEDKCDLQDILSTETMSIEDPKDIENKKNKDHAILNIYKLTDNSEKVIKQSNENNTTKQENHLKINETPVPETSNEVYNALNKVFGETKNRDVTDMSEFMLNEHGQNETTRMSNEKNDSCIIVNSEQETCDVNIVKSIECQDIENAKISNEKVRINNMKLENENITLVVKKSDKNTTTEQDCTMSKVTPMPRTADEIYEALNKMFGEPEDVNSVNVSVVVITEDSESTLPTKISKKSNVEDQLNVAEHHDADAMNATLREGLSSLTEDSCSEIWVEEVEIEDITESPLNSTHNDKEIEINNIEDLVSDKNCIQEVAVQEIKIESMVEANCYSSSENTGNNKCSGISILNPQNIIGQVEALKKKHILDNTVLKPDVTLKLETPDQEIEYKNEFESTFANDCNNTNINSEKRAAIQLNAFNIPGKYPEIEYEDPDIGTGYIFSIIDEDSETIKKNIYKSQEYLANNSEDEVVEDIRIIMPKHTYACPNGFINEMVRRSSRNMKRKKDMSDIAICGKKYRKGKNIDNPKITKSAIADLAYAKEYKRIIDYCSTIKFSYARPFHIENIVVSDMHKAWPIQMCHANEIKYSNNVEELLYMDTKDTENAMAITDPLKQTLKEEIENGDNVNNYKPIDINETNFNKGFGERSGRVIQKTKTGITKLSAATLSDVKQHQPFSRSKVTKVNLNFGHEIETQKAKLSNVMDLINIKEKVQSFFKMTAFELTKELLQDKKYATNDCHLSKFPFDLTSMEFMEVSRLETFVNVVQVNATAQNPMTCDPRVTQVSDASPLQCSDNSHSEDPHVTMETEYTELTTAHITLPLVQEYAQHSQSPPSQEQHSPGTDDDVNASIPTMSIVKIELMEEETSQENFENDFSPLPNNNVEYSFEETTNTSFSTSANTQNTSNDGNTLNTILNTSSDVDNTFTRMFNNSNNMDNAYTNTENTPSSMESAYTNTTSMYSTSSNISERHSSTEMDNTTNMDDASPNTDTTTNVDDTAMNVDSASTNINDTYTNVYPMSSDSNDIPKTTTNGGSTDNNIGNSPNDLKNRASDMNSTPNVEDSALESTAYDYSYENIEDYAANMENNNNAENYSSNVNNYADNAENYSNVDSYTSNVNSYSTNENYSTGVENYASNVENYATNIENYSSNVETYESNADNTTSNIDNNLTNIDNSTADMLEETQPQDLSIGNSTQESKICNTFKSQENEPSKSDQIAHAMNAAGISSDSVITSGANELVNLISQSAQGTANNYTKQAPGNQQINVMTLQQALAQVLPPPLSQTGTSENQMPNNPVAQQVLHIVQGNNAQTVINKPNGTHLLHIVQNKSNPPNGLSLVDAGLQQGGNQLIHIVNNGNQNNAQFLKRVNLLTNLTNAQGSNEQKMIQFMCKSADGKSIQLNAGPQRSMVLRLHPSSVQTMPKPTEPQDPSASASGENAANSQDPSQEIKSRSVYEENYAQFIQNSAPTQGSSTSSCQEKSTSLPKFNQVFGKQSYQENQNEINHNVLQENSECPTEENNINLEQPAEVNNPPLLERNAPPETTQAQPNPVQQIKQTISPMNIHTTMHGGVIYTRQIPVNIGGGQTINLITVPSTEMVDESAQNQQTDRSFVNQEPEQSSIIKLVPHHTPNKQLSPEENNAQTGPLNEPNHNPQPQPQPVLTQMRIKLPMLSKGPHMMPGARLVRPSFFQIQRNVIAGRNQPVYQQLVLTTAPSLGQTIRIPVQGSSAQSPQTQPILVQAAQHTQPSPHIPVQQVKHAPSSQHVHSARQAHSASRTPQPQPGQPEHTKPDKPDSELSPLILEQLREFDMVLEQVKERSVQPTPSTTPSTPKPTPADSTDGPALATTFVSESTQQVLYSVENNQPTNVVSYVNRKSKITSAKTSFARSPDSSGIVDTQPSSTQVQITRTVTSKSSAGNGGSTTVAHRKKKKKKKSSSSSSAMASLGSPSKMSSSLKPQEDEQTTQRILYILAEYKEQVENCPDKNKPAPRRRNQFTPTPGSKRKRSHCSSRASCSHEGVEMSPTHGEHGENGEDSLITIGSEDSSCGTTFSECTECQESHSPEDTPTKVVRSLTFEQETTTQTITQTETHTALPQGNVIVGDGQTITVARTTTATTAKPTTTVLMPANYLLPVSMIKGGQQIAIMTNRGPKILVGAGDTNAGALLFQRLIGPGLKPVLARPGIRHIRLPATALHNVQTFNLQTTPVTQIQPPDSTAPQAPTPAPPDLVDTRAMSSPWQDRENQDKPERGLSPDCTEPWNLPSSSIADDYGYEEIVRTDNMERTILDAIPDRYSPDMEAQHLFDKMFDVDSKKSMYDSTRCGYDIDTSDGDDRPFQQVVQQRKDGRHHRVTHVSTAALRHKYAILEHELRLQKSLSEECEDLGVDSPSASDLFPEADILFGAPSPAHEQTIDECNTPPPIPIPQNTPQPDFDDQIATDHLLTHNETRHDDLDLNLDDVGEIVTVGEDGVATIPTINAEEFARSHPNTTFHTEPEDGEITIAQPPFTIAQALKGRHITFHANRVPGTVVMAPQTTVISQATINSNQTSTVKFTDIDNMINSMPCPQPVSITSIRAKESIVSTRPLSTKFDSIKDEKKSATKPMSKFDSLLTESKLHLLNSSRQIVHSAGHGTQVIRRLRYDDKRNTRTRFQFEQPRARTSVSDEVKMRSDRAIVESMGDNASSPDQPELFWDSTVTERHESRFHFSESEKATKSTFDELLNDSSAYGPHTRLDSVIKAARPERKFERTSFEGISVSSDDSRPLRTYPPKRHTQETERHFTLKTTTTTTHEIDRTTTKTTHHHELVDKKTTPPICQENEGRRRTGRGLVKRGCSCCNNGSSAPPKKRSRPKKTTPTDLSTNS